MEAYNETGIDHYGGETVCTISTGERAIKNKLKKLAERFPDEVEICHENTDGSIMCHIPWKWIAIRQPRKVNLTEEQKKAGAERLRLAREAKREG